MANETATSTATNTTATDATEVPGGAAGPPVAPGGRGSVGGLVQDAIDGGVNGLDVAARFAGDVIRNLAPDFVQDLVPFLVIDVPTVVV